MSDLVDVQAFIRERMDMMQKPFVAMDAFETKAMEHAERGRGVTAAIMDSFTRVKEADARAVFSRWTKKGMSFGRKAAEKMGQGVQRAKGAIGKGLEGTEWSRTIPEHLLTMIVCFLSCGVVFFYEVEPELHAPQPRQVAAAKALDEKLDSRFHLALCRSAFAKRVFQHSAISRGYPNTRHVRANYRTLSCISHWPNEAVLDR